MDKFQLTITDNETGRSETVHFNELLRTMYYNFTPTCDVSNYSLDVFGDNEVRLVDYDAEVLDEEATIEEMLVLTFEKLLNKKEDKS